MIKSIRIQNFQSHKDSILEFHPGVNVIVGKSDSGKTAILRALNWLLTNRPSGDAFRSHWGGDTIVEVEFDNGQVQRIKGKKENLYILGMHDTFKAFGSGVPETIAKVCNIGDINYQGQMDAPFLLSNSPGEVARTLNRVANLDVIDTASSNIAKEKTRVTSALNHQRTELKDARSRLADFAQLPEMERQVRKLEKREAKVLAVRQDIKALRNALRSHSRLKSMLKARIPAERALETAYGLQKRVIKLIETRNSRSSLADIILRAGELAFEARKNANEFKRLNDEFNRLWPDQCPLCGKEGD